MATKIFFLGFVVLLTIQGFNASSLSRRDVVSDLVSLLESVVNNTINAVAQVALVVEQQDSAALQTAIDGVTNAVNEGKAAVNVAAVLINNTAQGINNAASAVLVSATQELSALENIAEASIQNFTNVLEQYGNGTYDCVYNNRPAIISVIGTAGSNVYNCTAAVVQTAAPILIDAVEVAKDLTDLSNKASSIAASCLPTGPLAVPCILLGATFVLTGVIQDVTDIQQNVKDIIANAPGLEQEIQSCSVVVKNATTTVYNLLGEIQTCVSTYVSSTP